MGYVTEYCRPLKLKPAGLAGMSEDAPQREQKDNPILITRENFVFGPKNNAPFLFDIETENLFYMS